MPTEDTIKWVLDAPYQDFIESFLPLYSSPCVTVRISPACAEYNVSKAILCRQSPYFAATFEGGFQEEQTQSTTLTEEEGVVSKRSFEMLVQWLYLGRVVFNESTPTESITAAIEFVRIADMCGVTGMETVMSEHIKAIILANPAPEDQNLSQGRDANTNTYRIVGQHITSAALLPDGHPVRKLLAITAVEGYIRLNHHKFWNEIRASPNFAVDLLQEVKETLKTVQSGEPKVTFIEPFSGKTLPFVTEGI